jgi:hypothetical protein
MKKKMLISLVACFIAAGSFIGYNFSENNHNMDISLADITLMAQADGESGTNCINCYVSWEYCPGGKQVIRCRLGGDGCFVEWQEPC